MSVDYIVASLPALAFGEPAPLTLDQFASRIAGTATCTELAAAFGDLEIQLRNAQAEARHGDSFRRPADGCSLYWRGRILACFAETDVARREQLLDRVWWDAAGELTPPTNPLGKGALATYYLRLRLALKRVAISPETGSQAFDRLTAGTKVTFTPSP